MNLRTHAPQCLLLLALTASSLLGQQVASDHLFTGGPVPAFMPLRIEAGKTYYLQARLSYFYGYNVDVLDLREINEDEGRDLVSITKRATTLP